MGASPPQAPTPGPRPSGMTRATGLEAGATTLPTPLPQPTQAGPSPAAGSSGLPLFPGQVLQPIDLAGVLRLAGAQNPDIAYARKQVLQAVADLEQARALWLPSLFLGPTYYRVDGQVQNINGAVETVSRGSLFLGATAATANGFPAPARGPATPA